MKFKPNQTLREVFRDEAITHTGNMTTRTIMTHVRKQELNKLTYSQLQIAALKAFPSSPVQKTIQAEMQARRNDTSKTK